MKVLLINITKDNKMADQDEDAITRNFKIVFLVSMFLLTTFFCFLPKALLHYTAKKEDVEMDRNQLRKLRRRKRLHKSLLSLTNCFASGVFLGVCLLDVLPEVEENFENFFASFPDLKKDFPVPQFCVVLGFLLLITIEQLANLCKRGGSDFNHHHHHQGGYESLLSSTASTIPPIQAIINHRHHHDSITNSQNHEGYGSISVELAPNNFPTSDLPSTLEEEIAEAENAAEDLREEDIERREVSNDPQVHSQVRYLMLALALAIHSIFEGLALGLMDKLSSVVQLFVAIAIHKCIIAFSFGINMAQSELSRCIQIASMMIFCLASPVGTLIGLGVEMVKFDEGFAGLVIGCLQGLACGSFLYIVFFELLPHEFFTHKKRPNPLLKVLSLTVGIAIMSLIMMISPV